MSYEGTVKIAVFESTGKYPYQSIYTEEEGAHTSDMVRISEWESVTFRKLTKEEIIPMKVESLNSQIQKIHLRAYEEVGRLEEVKKELLAITFDDPVNGEDDSIPF